MANAVNKKYDDSSIQHFEGLEQVRNKPTIYTGSIGQTGTFHLFKEAIGNILDEFTAGRCTTGRINVDTKAHTVEVIDDACGIPITKCEAIVSQMFTSGKYDKSSQGAYYASIGTNGCGLKIINALSDKFIIETYRDDKKVYGEYAKGKKIKFEITDCKNHPTGTRLYYHPDATVLLDIAMDGKLINDTLEILTFINPGLTFISNINGKEETFFHIEGMGGYLIDRIIKPNKYKPISNTINFTNHTSQTETQTVKSIDGKDIEMTQTVEMMYNVYFIWCDNVRSTIVESYVNGLRTNADGTHVTGTKMAITKAIKEYIDKNSMLPKNSKLEIDGNDVHESIILIVDARHSNPQYTTQVKDALGNKDIQGFISSSVYQQFSTWLKNNAKAAVEICKIVIRSAKAKAAALEAKNNIIKSGGKLGLANINMQKYNGCRSNDPDKCELFIVEGDSAGGSAKEARNTDYQAIFRIRGKTQNVLQSKNPTFSEELTTLIEILGCGIGATFNINKLRFHKIIFAADADDDGAAIRMLLAGFFFKYYKPIIDSGYVYEALPPLFKLTIGASTANGSNIVFLPNQDSFNMAIEHIACSAFTLETIKKHNPLSKELEKLYVRKLLGFKDFMDSYAVQTNLSSMVLEYIVRYYNDICEHDFKGLEALGYSLSILNEKEGKFLHINIDKDYEHYFLVIDSTFYSSIYLPIANKLSEIKLQDVVFKGNKTGTKYGGSSYLNACFIESLLLGHGTTVTREKGLGESDAGELKYYMFNPNTRTLVKLFMKDWDKAEKVFEMAMGHDIDSRKQFCMTGHAPGI